MFRFLFFALPFFIASVAGGATLIQSNIPSGAPFRLNQTNWDFKSIAQGKTGITSFFDVKNISTFAVGVTVNPVKNFTVTPATFPLTPGATKKVTITLSPNAPIGSLGTVFTFQATSTIGGTVQKITNWAILGNIVPAQPDLSPKIGASVSPSGNKYRVNATISVLNPANLVSSKACEGQLFLGSNRVATFPINPVTPGTAFLTNQTFETTKSGQQVLKVKVDTNNLNQEISETNNEATATITIP